MFIMEYNKITQITNLLLITMKVFLLLLATLILGWQYLTVTSTLKSRIQERVNSIDYVITEYLGEI